MVRVGLVVALLTIGLLIGGQMSPRLSDLERGREAVTAFRPWFWGNRALDLAVQAGLIFVGALGIAALLPRTGEDEEGR